MIWEEKVVSLSNYEEIFKDYSKDVKEVIRSALFDCTPIMPYIKRFCHDPYMLWQVKLCIDEGIDKGWFSICPNGSSLAKIRELSNKGINTEPLAIILQNSRLSETYFDYIIKWYENGIYLGNYDFSILPEDLLTVFDQGIRLGFPMHIFNNGVHFSAEYIMSCIRLLSNKKKITRFLDGDWDLANVSLLANYSKTKYYDKFIDYITKFITPSILEEIYECCKVGMPLKCVTALDTDGLYVCNGVQIQLAREAFLKKLDYERILKPGISVNEASSLLNEMELDASKKLSGRLRKNSF